MKFKRIIAVLMTLSVFSLFTATAFAATPKYEYGFDGTIGGAVVLTRDGDNEDGGNPGTMPKVNDSVQPQFGDGVNGQALYLDGNYGLLLDAKAVGETYTIAFWINPARFSNFGPFIQIGSDLLSEKQSATWLNITKTDWDGDSAPVIWSRNEALDAWPWYQKAYFSCGGGYQIPKNEWTHIAVTVDGSKPGMDPVLGTEVPGTVHSQLYINGEFFGEGPVAKGTFSGDAKVYVGINCWDIIFKGLIDDIKIYNTVLTANEVKTAMNEPAGTTSSSAPKTGVVSYAAVFGLGAALLGAGSVVLKKKEEK